MKGKDKERCNNYLEGGERKENPTYIRGECLEAVWIRIGGAVC